MLRREPCSTSAPRRVAAPSPSARSSRSRFASSRSRIFAVAASAPALAASSARAANCSAVSPGASRGSSSWLRTARASRCPRAAAGSTCAASRKNAALSSGTFGQHVDGVLGRLRRAGRGRRSRRRSRHRGRARRRAARRAPPTPASCRASPSCRRSAGSRARRDRPAAAVPPASAPTSRRPRGGRVEPAHRHALGDRRRDRALVVGERRGSRAWARPSRAPRPARGPLLVRCQLRDLLLRQRPAQERHRPAGREEPGSPRWALWSRNCRLLEPADRLVELGDVDAAGRGAQPLEHARLVALGLQPADEPACRRSPSPCSRGRRGSASRAPCRSPNARACFSSVRIAFLEGGVAVGGAKP